jgi:hypothetical protein
MRRPCRAYSRAKEGTTRTTAAMEHDHAVYVEPNVWVEHDLTVADPDGSRDLMNSLVLPRPLPAG